MPILILDDDQPLSRFLGRELTARHFRADVVHDAGTALEHMALSRYALLILDLNLPGMDGLDFMQQVRQTDHDLPVLVLTARNRKQDTVEALERGADDCLIKPFSFQELHARIGGLLRRKRAANRISKPSSALTVSREERRVVRGDRAIDLTPREFSLLEHLMQHRGQPVSRATLMQEVWNANFDPGTNVVDVYMKYLRDKIDRGEEHKLIRTVRGVGYVFGEA